MPDRVTGNRHWSLVIRHSWPSDGRGKWQSGAGGERIKQMQNEKCKVKSAKFKEKNTSMAGGIRRSGGVVFGES
jgi:hypothetical protein